MKKLIAVVNDLEGSGKTSFANALTYSYREAGFSSMLVTTDESDVDDDFDGEFWDLEDDFDLSAMIGALDSNDAVVLDIASGSARIWADRFEENELDTVLAEIDAEATIVLPYHESERNNHEVVDLMEIFSDSADYVIAHLPIAARRSESTAWKGSAAAKAAKYLGASEIELPGISADLETALEAHGLTLAKALNQLENLPRFAEVEVTQWREAAQDVICQEQAYLFAEPVASGGLHY